MPRIRRNVRRTGAARLLLAPVREEGAVGAPWQGVGRQPEGEEGARAVSVLRAVTYARVSTEDQAKNGTSLEGQEAACARKAPDLEAEVVARKRDEGVSGALARSDRASSAHESRWRRVARMY